MQVRIRATIVGILACAAIGSLWLSGCSRKAAAPGIASGLSAEAIAAIDGVRGSRVPMPRKAEPKETVEEVIDYYRDPRLSTTFGEWSAVRLPNGRWRVSLPATNSGQAMTATWEYDITTHAVVPRSPGAEQFSWLPAD